MNAQCLVQYFVGWLSGREGVVCDGFISQTRVVDIIIVKKIYNQDVYSTKLLTITFQCNSTLEIFSYGHCILHYTQ